MTRFLIWPGAGPAANAESAMIFARTTMASSRANMLDKGRLSYGLSLFAQAPRQSLYPQLGSSSADRTTRDSGAVVT